MEIKINSYSSQSSLISSLLCFIIGGILYTYAEVVLNFTSIAIGVVLSIVGVFSLITFYMDYKKGEIKKGKLLTGILTIVLAIVFLIFQNLVETLLGLTVGGWVLFVGVLRLISALRLNLKTKRFFINLVISLLLIILGIYTIANGGLLLEGAGILMMISSGIEIIGYIVNKILDKGNTTVVTETTVEEEVILTLPKLEKEEEPVEEKEEVKLIPEEASPKKPKRRGRKKKSVKDVEAKETKKTTKNKVD